MVNSALLLAFIFKIKEERGGSSCRKCSKKMVVKVQLVDGYFKSNGANVIGLNHQRVPLSFAA